MNLARIDTHCLLFYRQIISFLWTLIFILLEMTITLSSWALASDEQTVNVFRINDLDSILCSVHLFNSFIAQGLDT